MPHLLENKSLVFLLMVLLLSLVLKNTGLVSFLKKREYFSASEESFLKGLVKNEEGNGAATRANNMNVQSLMNSMGKSEITPSGTDKLGGMGGMNMERIRSMKNFMTENGEKMQDIILNNPSVSTQQREQFSQAMNMLNKMNI